MMTFVLLMAAAQTPTAPAPKVIPVYSYHAYALIPAEAKLLDFLKADIIAGTLPDRFVSPNVRVRDGKIEYLFRHLDTKEIWHEIVEAEINLKTTDILKPKLAFPAPDGGHFLHETVFKEIRDRLPRNPRPAD